MPSTIDKPTSKEQTAASKAAVALRQITSTSTESDSVLFEVEGIKTVVPRKVVLILEKVLDEMAAGKSVQIIVESDELTTQEAADLLHVSRPHLVKLLDTNKIPSKKVGTHRRVKQKDVLKYEAELKEIRRESLDFLAQEAQELGLGY